MMMMMSKTPIAFAALMLLLSTAAADSGNRDKTGPANDNVVVHLFEWSWKDVARECEDLGRWGYWGVQVSPPQEDVPGNQWWTRYQPVSYKLESRSGTAQEFAEMVANCTKHGVAIIVDAVINHMANYGPGRGRNGSQVNSKCDYPGLYSCGDFNHMDPCPDGKCSVCAACSNCIDLSCQGGDPSHIFRCNLNNGGGDRGLSDLDHSNPWVQQKISDYLNSLVDVGVAGIRIDASKHINPDHLAVILGKVKAPGLYVNQETILTGDCQCVSRDMYYKNGKLWEFNTPLVFFDVFSSNTGNMGKIRDMDSSNPGGWGCGWSKSDLAHTFVVNHDRLVNGGSRVGTITYFNNERYRLALITLLAHPYGQPNVLSSINFNPNTYKDESPTRSVFPDNCGWWGDNPKKDFTCEHRWPEIRNMVMWRKVAGLSGTPVFDIYNNKLLAITRGDNDQGRAFMIVNSHSDYFEQDVYTKMPAGQYCNIVAQGPGLDDCFPCKSTCPYKVNLDGSGRVHAQLGSYQAMAFHINSKVPPPSAEETEVGRQEEEKVAIS